MIVLFSSSLFKTGCIFYPVNKTCFSAETISWSKKDSMKNYSKIVELWRCPDVYGDFHWFCTNKWGDLIDITAEQYTIEGHKSPAENKNEWAKQYPLSFPGMRKRVDRVYGKIVLELDKIKNLDELK